MIENSGKEASEMEPKDRNFMELLQARWDESKFVCVGLDSELGKIPECVFPGGSEWGRIYHFNSDIVKYTKDIALAYKPNIAFYEAHGQEGIQALYMTIKAIREMAPDVPVILDAKRADIGNTNNGYVAMMDYLGADAITVHPYLGAEALKPFLDRKDKGVIVLCRTSNPGAGEFQNLRVKSGEPLYCFVARCVANEWNKNGNCALVVGATYPEELHEVRKIVSDMPLLIPGIGFQQKGVPLEEQVNQVVIAGKDSRGQGMIINSSRGIIFASKGEDFAEAAHAETQKLHDLITKAIAAAMGEVG